MVAKFGRTYLTKLKLDKEFGGGILFLFGIECLSCMHYYIPLCLNSKFRNASQDATKLIRPVSYVAYV